MAGSRWLLSEKCHQWYHGGMLTLTIRLPEDLAPRVRLQAYRDHVSVNKLVAYALLAYLDEKEAEREATQQA